MNHGVDGKERDVLDEATAALRDARIPDGPSPQLAASTVEAMLTSKTALDVIRRTQRRIIMFRIARTAPRPRPCCWPSWPEPFGCLTEPLR